MNDDDIYAFGAPAAPPPAARRPPRVGRWLLAGALGFVLLATLAGALTWLVLAEATREGFNVVVNGEPWVSADVDGFPVVLGLLGAGVAVLVVVLLVSLVVPLTILAGLLAAVLGLGLALLAVLLVAALALSPLWLILLALWLLLRRRPAPAATMRG